MWREREREGEKRERETQSCTFGDFAKTPIVAQTRGESGLHSVCYANR